MKRVALVTGASRGIGREIAIEFARGGVDLVVNYNHSQDKAIELKNYIEKTFGTKVVCCQADVSKQPDIDKLVDCAMKEYGKIDILINNAGIVYDREFEDIKREEAEQIFRVNMLAPLFLSQKIAPIMLKNGYGKIVNMSSTSGLRDFNPGTADYAMSKAALISLTKDLSMKYGKVINVNAVAPGWVDTDMNKDLPKDYIEEEMKKYHKNRLATPNEVAQAVVFLASDKASYITGEVLIVDGGHC